MPKNQTNTFIQYNAHCRILALEKLGVVFNQVSTPLRYTPRKFVLHSPTSKLIVIETDHNTFTEATKQQRKRLMAEVREIINNFYDIYKVFCEKNHVAICILN